MRSPESLSPRTTARIWVSDDGQNLDWAEMFSSFFFNNSKRRRFHNFGKQFGNSVGKYRLTLFEKGENGRIFKKFFLLLDSNN